MLVPDDGVRREWLEACRGRNVTQEGLMDRFEALIASHGSGQSTNPDSFFPVSLNTKKHASCIHAIHFTVRHRLAQLELESWNESQSTGENFLDHWTESVVKDWFSTDESSAAFFVRANVYLATVSSSQHLLGIRILDPALGIYSTIARSLFDAT